MARSFNEKMEKKRQAEYNRWKAECEVFGIWLQLRAVVLRITLSSQMN
jgi:hypothetical protein